MISREYKKNIQKDREHCQKCALVKEFCICRQTPNLNSNIRFILLTHSNELKKRTNTGVLIEKSLDDTLVIEWSRTEISKELMDIINSDEDVYLLYPDHEFEVENSANSNENKTVSSKTNVIILDGTWQESRKMFNRSSYLKKLKRISLTPSTLSDYKLRRKKNENHLCTVEAAIITLMLFDEYDNSELLKTYFEKFQISYKSSQSN